MLGERVQAEVLAAMPKPPAEPLGDFIANNQQAWADRQARHDRVVAAFGEGL